MPRHEVRFDNNNGSSSVELLTKKVLHRTAALEYAKMGIRVNAVNPGLIDTQIARDVVAGNEQAYAALAQHVPIGRAGRPEKIASVILWVCSAGAS
jgi:NAD(P)-dependent dehydrogenase (short-subunit alcohol dehydrogenase family)